ncbi:MAG: hypothetical protein HUK20_12065 [Fibrobacter sp.]|nr:hypothetical protein [Fibrobacter sp.]
MALILCAASCAFAARYSIETETNFVNNCTQGADKTQCSCALTQIESHYSEDEFKSIQSQMLMGETSPEYIEFVKKSMAECNPSQKTSQKPVKNASDNNVQLSEFEEAMFKAVLQNEKVKTSFIDECADEADDWLGKKQAKKSCSCAYDRLLKAPNVYQIIGGFIDEKGEVDDFEKWGASLIIPCLPEKFTPEIETAVMKECEEYGSKKLCKCALERVKKNYTVKTLVEHAMKGEKQLEAELRGLAETCVSR